MGTLLLASGALASDSPGPTAESAKQLEAMLDAARTARLAMDFQQAEDVLDRALERSDPSTTAALHARLLLERGAVRGHGGAVHRAEAPVRRAIELLEPLNEPGLLAEAYQLLARALNAQVRRDEAWQALDRAVALVETLDDPQRLADLEAVRSTLAVHRRDYETTRKAAWRALDILSGVDALRPLSNLAYAEHQLGELETAERRYGEVLRLAWEAGDQYSINFAYCNRAEVRWRLGGTKPALEDLEKAVEGFESARLRVAGGPAERAEFFGRQVAAYDRLVRFRADTGNARAAFEAAERFHARSLLDQLDPKARTLLRQPQPDLELAERQALDRLAQLQEDQFLGAEATAQPRTAELSELESTLRSIRSQWWQRDPERAAWIANHPPDLEKVQAGLSDGEVLVAYWMSQEQLFAWVVSPTAFRQVRIPVSSATLARKVEAYIRPLHSWAEAEDLALTGGEATHLALGRELYQLLVEPLPSIAHEVDRWIVVSDGFLHELPLASLVTGCADADEQPSNALFAAYTRCRYLGFEKALSRVPSAGVLEALRQRRRSRPAGEGELLALAPAFLGDSLPEPVRAWGPLEHNRSEARRVVQWFEGATLLEGDDASEARLVAEIGRHRRLHLATHGWVDDEHPLSSGLALAPGDGGDGLLRMAEILRLELSAELVTLSACRSGRGFLSRGEGRRGLGQAFLFAGASALVLSLWDVDDPATPVLMDGFYRRLAEGATPTVALRDARRDLASASGERRLAFRQRSVRYAHPRFWAGFVVLGDG